MHVGFKEQATDSFHWNKAFGAQLFCQIMSRDRLRLINKNLRIDDKTRKSVDPFTHSHEAFQLFTANGRATY